MKRYYPFTYSFRARIITAVILGAIVGFVMVFLEPFDTYQAREEYKAIKLLGYAVLCSLTYLFTFPLELFAFKRFKHWTITLEVFALTLYAVLAAIFTYAYHHFIYNGPELSLKNFALFTTNFSWGFIVLMLPILIYARKRFGSLSIATPSLQEKEVELSNQSGSERIVLNSQDILFIESQQNYVNIHHLDKDGQVQVSRLRNTLSKLSGQLDNLVPTHRSFLVNLQLVEKLSGSKRKAELKMKTGSMNVPVSQPYFDSIQNLMRNRP